MTTQTEYIMNKLIDNGYDSYLVGGCVRDFILKKQPKDYDIATNAKPEEIEKIFDKTIPTGKKYGTVTVVVDGQFFEVTTFRKDVGYSDGRRPDNITFSNSIVEDLSRRDFTMNAIAMDIKGDIIDPYGGAEDIQDNIIKFVGKTKDRLEEDRLRAFRLIRFMSTLNMKIKKEDFLELHNLNIDKISTERIRDEINKILLSNKPDLGIRMLVKSGLLDNIFPELLECVGFNQNNPNHSQDVFEHILSVVKNVEPLLTLRLSALFHDIGKPKTYSTDKDGVGHFYGHQKISRDICEDVMRRFKYSNKEIEDVSVLVYQHMSRYSHLRTPSVKKFIIKVGEYNLDDLFKLQMADVLSSKNRNDIQNILDLKQECNKILIEKLPLSLKDLNIDGYDLIKLGYKEKEIGLQLQYLLNLVIEDETKNIKNILVKLSERQQYDALKEEIC